MYLISYLNINKIIENVPTKKYRSIYYQYSSLVKLILFMNLSEIKNQSEMERYLKKHKRVRKKLGLKRAPDQAMISKFKNYYLTDETKEIITYICDKILQVAKELNINLNDKQLKSKKICLSSRLYYLDCEKRKAIKLLKNLLIEFKLIKIRHNSVYKLKDYIDLLIEMMLEHTYAETASDNIREDKLKEKKFKICKVCGESLLHPLKNKIKKDYALNYMYCPKCDYRERISLHGENLLCHITSKFKDVETLMKDFETLFEKIWNDTKKYNLFDKPVNISIDRTEIPFYGDINAVGINGKKLKDGTTWGYALYTVYISKYGRRYTLITLPLIKIRKGVPESLFLHSEILILKRLLLFAKSKVKIKCVLLDNGFFYEDTFNLCNELRLKYLTIPKGGEKKIIEDTKDKPSYFLQCDYPYNNCKINLFMIRKLISPKNNPRIKNEVIWRYATNLQPTGDKDEWIDTVSKLYPKRWGIETSYRKMKEDFYVRTTSKKYIIRLFYFELIVLFYNLWVFVNILVFFSLMDDVEVNPIIHAKNFLKIMSNTDPRG